MTHTVLLCLCTCTAALIHTHTCTAHTPKTSEPTRSMSTLYSSQQGLATCTTNLPSALKLPHKILPMHLSYPISAHASLPCPSPSLNTSSTSPESECLATSNTINSPMSSCPPAEILSSCVISNDMHGFLLLPGWLAKAHG